MNLGPSGLLFYFIPLELLPPQPNAFYWSISWLEFLTEEISADSENFKFYFYRRSEKNSRNRFFTVPTFWLLIRTFAAATEKKHSVSLIASTDSDRLAHNFLLLLCVLGLLYVKLHRLEYFIGKSVVLHLCKRLELRTHFCYDREEQKKPSRIRTHDVKSFAQQACGLPLCYNRWPAHYVDAQDHVVGWFTFWPNMSSMSLSSPTLHS